MQNLKYYVLWKKDSPLLKEYLEKFYKKLLIDIKNISDSWYLKNEIENLLKKENRDFILNADISSLINSIIIDNNVENIEKLKNEK